MNKKKLRLSCYIITLLLVLVMLMLGKPGFSQSKALAVGQRVPDISFDSILNYKSAPAKLSDFKGKLIILDFWSTFCGACIELFPKLNALQKQFNGDLQIILVNAKGKLSHDDKNKIEKLFDRLKQQARLNNELPIIYNCDTIENYFPCNMMPHEVWIDKEGKVVGITSDIEVNESNIRSLIEGKKVQMHLKQDIIGYKYDQPLATGNNTQNVIYQSVFTGYKEGVRSTSGIKPLENTKLFKGMYFYNYSLFGLCDDAFSDIMNLPPNRTIVDVTDPSNFKDSYDDSTTYQHSYCYDLSLPPTSFKQLMKYFRYDLHRYFNITVRKEIRLIECYDLVAGKSVNKIFTKGGKSAVDLQTLSVNKHIANQPVSKVVEILNYYFTKPVIDKTGVINNIDLKFPGNMSKRDLTKLLKSAGFSLRLTKRNMEVVVLTDKENNKED